MRSQTGMAIAVLLAVLGLQTGALAQWREGPRPGLFGERELGKPLKPRASRFGGGLERSPSGSFVGRTTADRGTTFQSRSPSEPAAPLLPPEAYYLEPDMVPSYLEEQARRMEAAREQQLQQQQQLQQLQQQQQVQQQQPLPYQQQPSQPSFPPAMPVMPERPDRYLPPAWPTQPGFPQPQPGVPGPAGEEFQNSPDRWFRGAPAPAQPDQQFPTTNPGASPQRYAPPLGLGPAGSLGPSGAAGQSGLSRSSAAALGTRIAQTLGTSARSPISATVQGDTVTLQGTVATAADRQLAERLAAMEPGVRRIDNRINVEPVPTGP